MKPYDGEAMNMRYSDFEQRQMDIKSGEELDRRSQKGRTMQPRVTDNDKGEITVALEGRELRGWSYKTRGEQREKMAQAREYVEGWCDGRQAAHSDAATWCEHERAKLGAVDGYDYRSGEEYGLRRAQIEIDRRLNGH